MEIWPNSAYLESTNRLTAAQPQSKLQVLEVPYRQGAALTPVAYGEMLITVIKGKGLLRTEEASEQIKDGDQVYLVQGDEFVLSALEPGEIIVVQIYWTAENIKSILEHSV